MNGSLRSNIKALIFIISVVVLLFLPIILFAQDGDQPCGGDTFDPTNEAVCPLDNWVWVLAIITVAFAAFYLKRRNKAITQLPLNR